MPNLLENSAVVRFYFYFLFFFYDFWVLYLKTATNNIIFLNILVQSRLYFLDYKKENLKVLLEHLSKPDIIKICIALRIRSPTKSTRAANKKEDLIEQILKACRTRTLLTITSSTEDLVRLEIIKNLGKHVVKIKDDFKNSFNRVYILATFTNPHMDDIDQFFKQMMHDNILFPEYDVTEYPVFYSQSEFNR